MGLDTDLVKIKKSDYDAQAKDYGGSRLVKYNDGRLHEIQVRYYRKCYLIQGILMAVHGLHSQCDYVELTRHMLEKAKRLAFIKRLEEPEEMKMFMDDLAVILAETDFETEVIAHNWC